MNQEELIKQVVEQVMKTVMDTPSYTSSNAYNPDSVDASNYPLGENMPEKIKSPTGKVLSDMRLDDMINGSLTAEDMRVSPETLEKQAQVAESVGRDAFAANLRRAADLINVPDDRVLEIYNALRPYRSTKQELLDIADELETKYGCKINPDFIRNAARVYEQRGRLKKD